MVDRDRSLAARAQGGDLRAFEMLVERHRRRIYSLAYRMTCTHEDADDILQTRNKNAWFWYIPLPDDMVSVGVVAEREYLYRHGRDPQVIFEREAATQPWIAHHLAPGKQCDGCRVTGDYAYRSRYCACDGLVLTGDALAWEFLFFQDDDAPAVLGQHRRRGGAGRPTADDNRVIVQTTRHGRSNHQRASKTVGL